MKYIFLLLFVLKPLCDCFAQDNADNSDKSDKFILEEEKIVQCWKKAFQHSFDFTSMLTDFETQLLDKNFLKDNSIDSYLILFDELKKKETSKKWHKITINQYISSSPFKHCMRTHKPSKENLRIRHWVFLFSIYHILSLDFATIDIQVYDVDSIEINGIKTDLEAFKQVFKVELDVLKQQEIPLEEVKVDVSLDEEQFNQEEILVFKKKISDYNLNNVKYVKMYEEEEKEEREGEEEVEKKELEEVEKEKVSKKQSN